MIARESFARMKRNALIINTGHGVPVDANAIVSAWRGALIAGTSIDVLDVEPPSGRPSAADLRCPQPASTVERGVL